jgi:hypothetical protein
MLNTAKIFLSVGIATIAINVKAAVLEFDDLNNYDLVTDGYGGLNWSNFSVSNGSNPYNIITGFNFGIISPSNAIFNDYGDPATISSSTPFTLNSGYFASAYTDGLIVTVQGYSGDTLTRTVSFTLSDTSFTFVNLNLANITSATFTGSLSPEPDEYYPKHFTIDNLTISEATVVPEPSTYGLIGIGALGLAFAARRRKLKSA